MPPQKPLLYFKDLFFVDQFNRISANPVMELFNKLPIQQMKDMFDMFLPTPATFNASFFVSIIAISSFILIVLLIRELIQVLKDLRADGKYKMNAIKKIEALGQKHEGLQQQIQHLEQQVAQLGQQMQEQCQKQQEKERSGNTRYESLQLRVNILDKFMESSFCWSKFQQDQESLNHTLSEATYKVSNRVSRLEIKYTTAIRGLEKRLRKMDRIVADNFNVLTKYTKEVANYCKEDKEESKKMADALFALQDQVNEGLRTHQSHIKDLAHYVCKIGVSQLTLLPSDMLHQKKQEHGH